METFLIALAVLTVLATVAWLVLGQHPEERTRSPRVANRPTTTSDQPYGGADRTAGPDVEPMDPDRLGGDHRPPS